MVPVLLRSTLSQGRDLQEDSQGAHLTLRHQSADLKLALGVEAELAAALAPAPKGFILADGGGAASIRLTAARAEVERAAGGRLYMGEAGLAGESMALGPAVLGGLGAVEWDALPPHRGLARRGGEQRPAAAA